MNSPKLRGGVVTTIRINPTDCLSILDAVEAVGMAVPGMSFAQQVSITLSSLLATARRDNLIPEPDTFQYLNRMQPYLNGKNNKRKQAMTDALAGAGGSVRVKALVKPQREVPIPPAPGQSQEEEIVSPEQREARRELTELLMKKDMAAVHSEVVWGDADQRRHDELMEFVYGG